MLIQSGGQIILSDLITESPTLTLYWFRGGASKIIAYIPNFPETLGVRVVNPRQILWIWAKIKGHVSYVFVLC